MSIIQHVLSHKFILKDNNQDVNKLFLKMVGLI